jgi:hypothetical protein
MNAITEAQVVGPIPLMRSKLLEVLIQMRADLLVQGSDLLVQGLDHRIDALAQHPHRAAAPVEFGDAHVHQLLAAQHHDLQRLQVFGHRAQVHAGLVGLVGQRVGIVRQGQCVDGVGLGQVPHAAGKLARRTWVDHRHRQAQLHQQAGQRVLQAAGGLDDDQPHATRAQVCQQALEAGRVVAGTLSAACAMHAPFEAGLGHVHADVVHGPRIGCGFTSSVRHIPSLQDAKCVRVTVRAWRRTPVRARPIAQGRARGSRGRRAVHALAKPLPVMPNLRGATRWICGRCG